jgi:hypothetical protein
MDASSAFTDIFAKALSRRERDEDKIAAFPTRRAPPARSESGSIEDTATDLWCLLKIAAMNAAFMFGSAFPDR